MMTNKQNTKVPPTDLELELELFCLKNPTVKTACIFKGSVVYLGKTRDGKGDVPYAAPQWITDGNASIDLIAEYDMKIAFSTTGSVCAIRVIDNTEYSACEIIRRAHDDSDDVTTLSKKRSMMLAVVKLAITLEKVAAAIGKNNR